MAALGAKHLAGMRKEMKSRTYAEVGGRCRLLRCRFFLGLVQVPRLVSIRSW